MASVWRSESVICEHEVEHEEAKACDAKQVVAFLRDVVQLDTKGKEHFIVLILNGKRRVIGWETVSIGTLTASIVHPREVFRPVISQGGAACIVAHNHPSGDPEPSQEDLEVTERLRQAGETLGVPLLDHIIIGRTTHVSLRARGVFGA